MNYVLYIYCPRVIIVVFEFPISFTVIVDSFNIIVIYIYIYNLPSFLLLPIYIICPFYVINTSMGYSVDFDGKL